MPQTGGEGRNLNTACGRGGWRETDGNIMDVSDGGCQFLPKAFNAGSRQFRLGRLSTYPSRTETRRSL